MYKPRKTTDLMEDEKANKRQSSGTRSSRVSRLAVPTNRQSVRSSSARANRSTIFNQEAASASKNNRSRSVCATPLRTPKRASNAPTGTAEKDRKVNTETAAVILETLNSHPAFSNECLPNGLKSITNKQFISVLTFFMKSVIGNSRGQKLNNENVNTDDITKWLTLINYPHMQSKSWLKTPNVPHAFSHLVQLLQWLCRFIPTNPDDPFPNFGNPDNICDFYNCFPNNNYIANHFMAIVPQLFISFNNSQEDDSNANKSKLVDEFIRQTISGSSSSEQLQSETKKINIEIEALGRRCPVITPKQLKYLETQQQQQTSLENEQKRLMDNLHAKQLNLQRIKSELTAHNREQSQLLCTLNNLKAQVQGQAMTKAKLNQLLELSTEKKNAVESKRNAIAKLKNIGHDTQLKYARQLKIQTNAIAKYNLFVHEVATKNKLTDYQDLCVDLKLSVLEVGQPLRTSIAQMEAMKSSNLQTAGNLELIVSKLKNQHLAVETDLKIQQTQLDELVRSNMAKVDQLRTLENTSSLTRVELSNISMELQKSIENTIKTNCELSAAYKTKHAFAKELEKENEMILQNTDAMAQSLMSTKMAKITAVHTEVTALRARLDEMRQQLNENQMTE